MKRRSQAHKIKDSLKGWVSKIIEFFFFYFGIYYLVNLNILMIWYVMIWYDMIWYGNDMIMKKTHENICEYDNNKIIMKYN
jgi:hypothetical protein